MSFWKYVWHLFFGHPYSYRIPSTGGPLWRCSTCGAVLDERDK